MSYFPYPGLRPFQLDETDIFFGREEQVDRLLDKLEEFRFLAVVGPSGCGKSSLVQAGMLAGLEAGFLASAGVRWRTARMHPGHSPMRNLAKALLEEAALWPERGIREDSGAFLLAALRRGPLGLIEALQELPLPKGTNLMILVDQFEEVFRCRKYDADEAQAFIDLLLASARQSSRQRTRQGTTNAYQGTTPVYVVITMRSDFMSDCAFLSGLPEAMNESQFLIPRLRREESQTAIIGPAEVFGGKVEPGLVSRLLNDMGKDKNPDQLPLMQHVLMRMWTIAQKRGGAAPSSLNRGTVHSTLTTLIQGNAPSTLTMADYEAIGGLEKALTNNAEEAFEELEKGQKRIAETLFRSLSDRSAAMQDSCRPVRLSEIAAVAGVNSKDVARVVEVFRRSDRNFLTPPAGIPLLSETIINISHESLIRQWPRLNEWAEAEATSASVSCRLKQTANYLCW